MVRRCLKELAETGKVTLSTGEPDHRTGQRGHPGPIAGQDGWAAAQGRHCVVVLATELTAELIREGMARDVVRLVQDRRKEMDLQFSDRIHLGLVTASDELRQAIGENPRIILQRDTGPVTRVSAPVRRNSGRPRSCREFHSDLHCRRQQHAGRMTHPGNPGIRRSETTRD